MPILGVIASGISGHLTPAITTNFKSISTITVDSGGASSITFSSIPQTYSHLQLRIYAQTNRTTYGRDDLKVQFNGDTGNNYEYQYVSGQGSGGIDFNYATSSAFMATQGLGTGNGGQFGIIFAEFLNYKLSAIYRTMLVTNGNDHNGTIAGYGGTVGLSRGTWNNTTAVSSITLTPVNGTSFNNYSKFALYGIV